MECQDAFFEVLIVSVPVGTSLHRADFIVDAFDGSAGDRFEVPVEQSLAMSSQRLGHGLENSNAGSIRSSAPIVQELLGGLHGLLIPELSEILFQVIGSRQWLVERQRLLKLLSFIDSLRLGEVFRILQEQPPDRLFVAAHRLRIASSSRDDAPPEMPVGEWALSCGSMERLKNSESAGNCSRWPRWAVLH